MGSAVSKQRRKSTPQLVSVQLPSPRPNHPEDTQLTGSNAEKIKQDVMLSYSHSDAPMMRKLCDMLKKNGISVWVDEQALTPGAFFLREIGEAIVACRLFIVLLSSDSVVSKYCQDEVSLAYISNKNIFAVSLMPYDQITAVMDLGMKLTLSCVQWTFLNENQEEALSTLLTGIKFALVRIQEEVDISTVKDEAARVSGDSADEELNTSSIMNKQAVTYSLGKYDSTLFPKSKNLSDDVVAAAFWKLHVGEVKEVEWNKFSQILIEQLRPMWAQFSASEDSIHQLIGLICKEMDVTNNKLLYKSYILFCTKGSEVLALDEAIRLFAAAAVAVREVFQMDSSVRLTAIENLGDHKAKAVINVLLDLLYDDDHDVRVVAAISLAHAASEFKKPRTRSKVVNGLLSCLNSDDRLVRESGCLALGRMKSKIAIKKLVYLWRNDYISSVREAAQIAIHEIGGDEAEQALHITRVLGEEIQKLKH